MIKFHECLGSVSYLIKAFGKQQAKRYKSKNMRAFRWIGHTRRKDDEEIPKAALLWNPQGRRGRGRPT
jgi:hypothetical protein